MIKCYSIMASGGFRNRQCGDGSDDAPVMHQYARTQDLRIITIISLLNPSIQSRFTIHSNKGLRTTELHNAYHGPFQLRSPFDSHFFMLWQSTSRIGIQRFFMQVFGHGGIGKAAHYQPLHHLILAGIALSLYVRIDDTTSRYSLGLRLV